MQILKNDSRKTNPIKKCPPNPLNGPGRHEKQGRQIIKITRPSLLYKKFSELLEQPERLCYTENNSYVNISFFNGATRRNIPFVISKNFGRGKKLENQIEKSEKEADKYGEWIY